MKKINKNKRKLNKLEELNELNELNKIGGNKRKKVDKEKKLIINRGINYNYINIFNEYISKYIRQNDYKKILKLDKNFNKNSKFYYIKSDKINDKELLKENYNNIIILDLRNNLNVSPKCLDKKINIEYLDLRILEKESMYLQKDNPLELIISSHLMEIIRNKNYKNNLFLWDDYDFNKIFENNKNLKIFYNNIYKKKEEIRKDIKERIKEFYSN